MTALVWAIKTSLLGYVRGAADGWIRVSEGAEERPEGFAFPAVEPASEAAARRFSGRVVLAGHRGLLYLEFADPVIQEVDGRILLTLADGTGERIAFATLDRVPGVGEPSAARLAAEGEDVMLGNYREGDELAPVALEAS